MSVVWYILVLLVIAAAIAYVVYNYQRIRKMPEGTQEMAEMAGIIRSGANTFMKTEYKTIVVVVPLLFISARTDLTRLMLSHSRRERLAYTS